jgi:uncharacterized protein (DUF2147 family)
MRRIGFATFLSLVSTAALAAEPTGEWTVEDGVARVRIEKCADKYWGVISWEQKPGGIDTQNPDPAKRGRPTMGMPILLGMAAAPDGSRWEGEIYNSQNGKTYKSKIYLSSPDVLRVEGCVAFVLCGGQNWKRHVEQRPVSGPPGRPHTPPPRGAQAPAHGAAPAAANTEFCSKLSMLPRFAHQGGLK